MGFWKAYATGRGNRASSFERGAIGLKLQSDANKQHKVAIAENRAYDVEKRAKEQAHGIQVTTMQSDVSNRRSAALEGATKAKLVAEANKSRQLLIEERKERETKRRAAESARLSEMQKVRATPIRTKSKTNGHKRITTAS
jgi:hypothetical protein